MTIWLVLLNGYVQGAAASAAGADALVHAVMARPSLKAEQWRTRPGFWSSPNVTSLSIRPITIHP